MITVIYNVITILDAWDTTPDSDLPAVCSNAGLTGLYSALSTVFNVKRKWNIICSIHTLNYHIPLKHMSD